MEQVRLQTTAKAAGNKKIKNRNVKATKKVLLTITDHAPDVMCRFDRNYRLLYVNPDIGMTYDQKAAS